jgi:hypothetical protein
MRSLDMKTFLLVSLALVFATGAGGENQAIEARASTVVLPSEPPSSLVVPPCEGCKPMLVHTSRNSRYFVNRQEVGLEELRKRLTGKPDAFVTVFYDDRTGQLHRLVAHLY